MRFFSKEGKGKEGNGRARRPFICVSSQSRPSLIRQLSFRGLPSLSALSTLHLKHRRSRLALSVCLSLCLYFLRVCFFRGSYVAHSLESVDPHLLDNPSCCPPPFI